MFNRRMFVAVAVCVAISASSAFAGGNGGTKKNATINVNNSSGSTVYVILDKSPEQILDAVRAQSNRPPQDVLASLGRAVNHQGKQSFQVKSGPQRVVVVDPLRFTETNPRAAVLYDNTVQANTQTPVEIVINRPVI